MRADRTSLGGENTEAYMIMKTSVAIDAFQLAHKSHLLPFFVKGGDQAKQQNHLDEARLAARKHNANGVPNPL